MKKILNLLTLLIFFCSPFVRTQESKDAVHGIDPSGGWRSGLGVLSLMLCGDALSFSYSSVFHSAVHICDGAGVAGLVAENEYHFVDDQGTVAFLVREDGVELKVLSGICSFCGAEWPGERFSREGYEPLELGRVDADKLYFHVVMPAPPQKRKGYVIKGDVLETAPCRHEGGDDFLLARYKGKRGCTVGLIDRFSVQMTSD